MRIIVPNTQGNIDTLEKLGYISTLPELPGKKYIKVKGIKYCGCDGREEGYKFYDYYSYGPFDSDPLYILLEGNKEKIEDTIELLKDNLGIKVSVAPRCIGQQFLNIEVFFGNEKIIREKILVTRNSLGQWKT